ncbi:VirE2 family protein [Mesorhizobium sp. Cs1299R1N1]|uniref:VirE2 family protein n=1 Tax=Mesorhizobium sp. Cs1299R1N1 TaxID=3015172 RepID=UPI00301B84A9
MSGNYKDEDMEVLTEEDGRGATNRGRSRSPGRMYDEATASDGEDKSPGSEVNKITELAGNMRLAERMKRHQNKPAAKLPSDDRLLVASADPIDSVKNPKGTRWTFLNGSEFQKEYGPKTPEEMDRELVYIKYNDSYHTKSGLWNAIKDPNSVQTTLTYKDREFRRIAVSCGLTAERSRDLYQSGTKSVTDEKGKKSQKPNYALKGQNQLYDTNAGPRKRAVAYKDAYVNGESAPDCMLRLPNGLITGFSRLPGDGLTGFSPEQVEGKLGGKLLLKSLNHGYQTLDYINRTQGRDAALHRFADYLEENRAHNKNTDTAYVKIDDTYFPVKQVLSSYPDDRVSKTIGGSRPTLDERILIRMPTGNTFATPDWVAESHPDYFKGVCKAHGINEEWGRFKPKWNERLDKHASHSRVLIEEDGNLVEDASLVPKEKSVLDVYPPNRIFYEGDSKYGDRTGNFTSLAESYRRATSERNDRSELNIPKDVTDILLHARERFERFERGGSSQPPPGYDARTMGRERGDPLGR